MTFCVQINSKTTVSVEVENLKPDLCRNFEGIHSAEVKKKVECLQ